MTSPVQLWIKLRGKGGHDDVRELRWIFKTLLRVRVALRRHFVVWRKTSKPNKQEN